MQPKLNTVGDSVNKQRVTYTKAFSLIIPIKSLNKLLGWKWAIVRSLLGSITIFLILGLFIGSISPIIVRTPFVSSLYRRACTALSVTCKVEASNHEYIIYNPTLDLIKEVISTQDEEKRLKEKVMNYQSILSQDDRDSVAWTNLGEALRRLGSSENAANAVIAHKKALNINPDLVPALIGLALSEAELGHLKEANIAIEKAIKKDPKIAISFIYKAEILFLQQDLKGSQQALKQARALDPNYEETIKNISDLLVW